MKRKILITFLIIFICSGCTVNYNLTIDKDLKVKEQIKGLETNKTTSNLNNEELLNVLIDSNSDYVDKNNVEKIIDNDSYGVKIINNYDSLDEYFNKSIYYKQYFEKVNYDNDNGKITIESSNNIKLEYDNPEKFYINKGTINIKVPFKVTNSNADKINKFTNTYTWSFDEDTENKNIHLEFDINESRFDYSVLTKYIPIVLTIVFIVFVAYVVIKIVKSKRLESNKF